MELKKYIGSRIRDLRNQKGIEMERLAEMLNTTKQTVSRYELGERQANQDILFKLAAILDVSVDEFFPRTKKEEVNKRNIRNYPFIPYSVSAGLPCDIEAVTDTGTIPLSDDVMGKWSGSNVRLMRVNGESMNKVIPNKSLIAFKDINLFNLKDYDIVVFSNDHEYSVKRFYNDVENERFIFSPESTSKGFIDYVVEYDKAQELQIHGKVVLYIVELD